VAAPMRVVVADDDPSVRRWLTLALEASGTVEVIGEAADGADAMERAVVMRPDAVIVDLQMPLVDGYTAVIMLQRRLPSIRVIVHSGCTQPDLLREVERLGVPVVHKTGDVEPLLEALLGRVPAAL
jgi:DNA-binding NarL/FixJ family response regulator